jgi:hypothetical protein
MSVSGLISIIYIHPLRRIHRKMEVGIKSKSTRVIRNTGNPVQKVEKS